MNWGPGVTECGNHWNRNKKLGMSMSAQEENHTNMHEVTKQHNAVNELHFAYHESCVDQE